MKGTAMAVLLEVFPAADLAQGNTEKGIDYEAFTIHNFWEAADVFTAEYRKVFDPDAVERLESFLDGPLVRRRLRPYFGRDIRFDPIDYTLSLRGVDQHGNAESWIYRLSIYNPGRHSM